MYSQIQIIYSIGKILLLASYRVVELVIFEIDYNLLI